MSDPRLAPARPPLFFFLPLAHASVVATLNLSLPGGAQLQLEQDTADLPSTAVTSVEDNLGRMWDILVNVDDLGANALVVMDIRVSAGGVQVDHHRPQLLIPIGKSGSTTAGEVLPVRVDGTAARTSTKALRAIERSVFYDGKSSINRIKTWWPNARVRCWDPSVSHSAKDGWLEFAINKRLGPGQSVFTQCSVDERELSLYFYTH